MWLLKVIQRISEESGWLPSSAHPFGHAQHPRWSPEACYRWQKAMGSSRLGTRMPKCSISTGSLSVATTSYLRTIWNTHAQKSSISPSPAGWHSTEPSFREPVRNLPSKGPSGAGARLTGDQCTFSSRCQTGDVRMGWSSFYLEAIVQV